MASDLEDLTVLRKQYPEFIKMCKAVGIETDTELGITMGDIKNKQIRIEKRQRRKKNRRAERIECMEQSPTCPTTIISDS